MTTIVLSSGLPHSMIATTPDSHRSDAAILSSSPLPSPSWLLAAPSRLMKDSSDTWGAAAETANGASALLQHGKSGDREPPSRSDQSGSAERHHTLWRSNVAQQPDELNEQAKNASAVFKTPSYIVVDSNVIEKSGSVTNVCLPTPHIQTLDEPPPKKGRKKNKKLGNEPKRQAKIKKHRVTKLCAFRDPTTTKNGAALKTAKDDRSPERLLTDAIAKKRNTVVAAEQAELGLEEALRRRLDWTPIRDTITVRCDVSPETTKSELQETPKSAVKSTGLFKSLVQDYGFSDQQGTNVFGTYSARLTPDTVGVKKRRIELTNTAPNAVLTVGNIKKPRLPPKKLQTITSKATEDFVHQGEDSVVHTLTECRMPLQTPATDKQIKRTSAKARVSSKAKKKKNTQPDRVVLSPEAALRSTRDQNFVFGTSSQLARGVSPMSTDSYQQIVDVNDPGSKTQMQALCTSIPLQRPRSLGLSPSKNLWSAAACHSQAGFADTADTADTVDSPPANEPNASTFPDKNTVNSDNPASRAQDEWHDIAEMSIPLEKPDHNSKRNAEELDIETRQSLPRSVAEKGLKSRPTLNPSKKKVSTSDPSLGQKPNYQGCSDVELKKKIKSYGFKTIRKRSAMILLLEKCWESKASHVLQDLPSNSPTRQLPTGTLSNEVDKHAESRETKSSSSVKIQRISTKFVPLEGTQNTIAETQPKKPRGRPKKSTMATTSPPVKKKRKASTKAKAKTTAADVGDEIYDSSSPTPSPPRRRTSSKLAKSLVLSPGAKKHAVAETTNDPSAASKTDPKIDARILAAITRAVMSQTPTHDSKNPSWHEKILMYDPIVIEDLTLWLNVEGLNKVDEDDEVGPMLVKAWCESRSICCLWRENLRGLPRARW